MMGKVNYIAAVIILALLAAGAFFMGRSVSAEAVDSAEADFALAAVGNVNAMYRVGEYYENDRYYLEALKWYELAANAGSATAMYKLGNFYMEGYIIEDAGLAVEYFRQSAECGSKLGQSAYGKCLYYGIGAEEDRESGIYWMNKAASQSGEPVVSSLNLRAGKGV